jgi:hypothetical protein
VQWNPWQQKWPASAEGQASNKPTPNAMTAATSRGIRMTVLSGCQDALAMPDMRNTLTYLSGAFQSSFPLYLSPARFSVGISITIVVFAIPPGLLPDRSQSSQPFQ